VFDTVQTCRERATNMSRVFSAPSTGADDVRHKSLAEKDAARSPLEKEVRQVARQALKSMQRVVATVSQMARHAAEQVSAPQPAAKKAKVAKPVLRTVAKPASKTQAKAAVTKAAKPAAKKDSARPATRKIASRSAGKAGAKPARKKA
jgi:hypothetical protein